jgi:hypothetical protein
MFEYARVGSTAAGQGKFRASTTAATHCNCCRIRKLCTAMGAGHKDTGVSLRRGNYRRFAQWA